MITKLLKTDNPFFETHVKKWECSNPQGLFAIEISGIQKNDKLEIIEESTYQFFMTEQQLKDLAELLIK